MDKIMEYDVLMTPGLIVNDKIKVFGRDLKEMKSKSGLKKNYRTDNPCL